MRRLEYVKADVTAAVELPPAPLPSALFVNPLFWGSVQVGVLPARCCNLCPVLAPEGGYWDGPAVTRTGTFGNPMRPSVGPFRFADLSSFCRSS